MCCKQWIVVTKSSTQVRNVTRNKKKKIETNSKYMLSYNNRTQVLFKIFLYFENGKKTYAKSLAKYPKNVYKKHRR